MARAFRLAVSTRAREKNLFIPPSSGEHVMAKAAKAKKQVKQAPTEAKPGTGISHKTLYAVLFVVALLFIVAIFVAMSNRQDSLTSWATIKSQELHVFMKQCRDTGGSVDVRPNQAPQIVFVCQYADHSIEYSLAPGK
jgi:hypothetical protein